MNSKSRFAKKILIFLIVTIALSVFSMSVFASEVSTSAASTRGVFNSTQISYINNANSGKYMKYVDTTLSAQNGLLSSHGNSIKWTITPINDGSGYYTISTLTTPPLYLSSVSSTVSLTLGTSSIPTALRWDIQTGYGGGCTIKSVNTNRYLYESNGSIFSTTTLYTIGTASYRTQLWRIADSTSYYGNNSSYQYVELTSGYKIDTLYLFANDSGTPQLSDEYDNVMWGGAENFTFSGYNTSYLTLNSTTGTFSSSSSTTRNSCTVTATHKITGYETTFTVVVNPRAALIGVTASGHDHTSLWSPISSYLTSNGYSSANYTVGVFSTSDIDNYLSEDTYNVFVSRSHGGAVTSGGNLVSTYILINQSSLRYDSSGSIKNKDLSNLRLAMFIGCDTGEGGVGGKNLPSVAVEQGAETAIGFTDTIYCTTANNWTKEFFSLWDSGYSVEMACAYLARSGGTYASTTMTSYIVCGDGQTTID